MTSEPAEPVGEQGIAGILTAELAVDASAYLRLLEDRPADWLRPSLIARSARADPLLSDWIPITPPPAENAPRRYTYYEEQVVSVRHRLVQPAALDPEAEAILQRQVQAQIGRLHGQLWGAYPRLCYGWDPPGPPGGAYPTTVQLAIPAAPGPARAGLHALQTSLADVAAFHHLLDDLARACDPMTTAVAPPETPVDWTLPAVAGRWQEAQAELLLRTAGGLGVPPRLLEDTPYRPRGMYGNLPYTPEEATYQVPPAPLLRLASTWYDPARDAAAVDVAWTPPRVPPGRRIMGYQVQVSVAGHLFTYDVDEPDRQGYVVEWLTPDQSVSIIVFAQDDQGGWSAPSNQLAVQTAARPGAEEAAAAPAARVTGGCGDPECPICAPADPVAEAAAQAAQGRATALLQALLSPAQRDELIARKCFTVQGSAGGCYEIAALGQSGNVTELCPDGSRFTWCAAPRGWLPDADAYAAQLLHLRYDEPGFRAVANRLGYDAPDPAALVPVLADAGARLAATLGGQLAALGADLDRAATQLAETILGTLGSNVNRVRVLGGAPGAADACAAEARLVEIAMLTGAGRAEILAAAASYPGTLAEFHRAVLLTTPYSLATAPGGAVAATTALWRAAHPRASRRAARRAHARRVQRGRAG